MKCNSLHKKCNSSIKNSVNVHIETLCGSLFKKQLKQPDMVTRGDTVQFETSLGSGDGNLQIATNCSINRFSMRS